MRVPLSERFDRPETAAVVPPSGRGACGVDNAMSFSCPARSGLKVPRSLRIPPGAGGRVAGRLFEETTGGGLRNGIRSPQLHPPLRYSSTRVKTRHTLWP